MKKTTLGILSIFVTISSVCATNTLTDTLLQIEKNDSNLNSVKFYNFGGKANEAITRLFKALEKNTFVTSVEISQSAGLGDEGSETPRLNDACLKIYENAKNKMTIEPPFIGENATKSIAKSLGENKKLESLTFQPVHLARKWIELFAKSIKKHPTLKKIVLKGNIQATEANIIIQNRRLETLHFIGNPNMFFPEEIFHDDFLKHVFEHKSLKNLSFKNCGMSQSLKDSVHYKYNLSGLEHSVAGNHITVKSLDYSGNFGLIDDKQQIITAKQIEETPPTTEKKRKREDYTSEPRVKRTRR